MRRKITALAVGTLALSGGIPAGASAAEPGFTVDPQSPAGVEYQIPLENARGQGGGSHGGGSHGGGSLGGASGGSGSNGGGGGAAGGGGTGGSGAGTSSASLFGAGITPATSSGRSNGASGSSSGSAGNGKANGGGSGQASAGSRHLPTALTASADYSSTGPIAGIVAAILITGAAFGLFLRQRAHRPKKIFS